MHPQQPPAAPTSAAAPAPTDPSQALVAHLDDVMEQAAIAANAQRDEEAGVPPVAPPVRQEAQPQPTPAPAGDDEGDEDEDEDEEPATPPPAAPEPAPAEPPAATSTEPPKYSRRDAARFAEQATQREKEATEARQIAERAQAELNAIRASDQHILTSLGEISGYTRDTNGRFKYENLRDKVVRGEATDEERQTVAEMTQWHELAGPIYRQAERQVSAAFSTNWGALKDLDGIGEQGLQTLNAAADGVAGARELHRMAYAAGQKAAKTESEQTIARLKGELKEAKNKTVAALPQPAVPGGTAVPSGGGWRDRAFDANGLTTDEFDREVRAGKWLGVDLAAQ